MSLKGLRGPQRWRVLLLVRAQVLVYRRYPWVLSPFKYPAYMVLLDILDVQRRTSAGDSDPLPSSSNFLAPECLPLMDAACQLLHLTYAHESLPFDLE